MVHYRRLDRTFAALSDATRLAIVDRLSRGDATVSEIAAPFDMSLPAVLKHIAVLEDAHIVRATKTGRVKTCSLNGRSMDQAMRWMASRSARWEASLSRLATHFEKETKR